MKQFLRYQISGSVYILWVIIFYYGRFANNFDDLLCYLSVLFVSTKMIAGLIATALPLGVLIHQFSVCIKNWIVGCIFPDFKDRPIENIIKRLDAKEESVTYCLERISNLNSFYYVRFDNGLLSPLLAWLSIRCFFDGSINWFWELISIGVGFVTIVYLPFIYLEIKEYRQILDNTCTETRKLSLGSIRTILKNHRFIAAFKKFWLFHISRGKINM